MRNLVLLGDSILDNAPYVTPEPDTATHLRRTLSSEWSVVLLARDGSTMADLPFQLSQLPSPTHVAVLSVGGNDAIEHIGILEQRVRSSAEVLEQLYNITEDFAARYQRALEQLRLRVERLILCTIYEPPLIDPVTARLARVPLALLNDRILRAGSRLGFEVIDLRAVCTESADFVQEIEPSPAGARKIAQAIEAVVRNPSSPSPGRIFAAQQALEADGARHLR